MRHSDLKGFYLVLALFLSFLTYTAGEQKALIYFVAFLGSVGLAFCAGIGFSSRRRLLLWVIIFYFFVSIVSVSMNIGDIHQVPLQMFAYPLVAFLVVGSLWKVLCVPRVPALILVCLFVLNGVVALLGVFGFDNFPFLGKIQTGRALFMTNLPSAAGLVWNVNYFAATQAVGFWLLYSLWKQGALPRAVLPLIWFVGGSVILGSSRSCTISLVISVAFYWYWVSKIKGRMAIFLGVALLISAGSSIYLYALTDPELYSGLRLYKGLNNRDELWEIAFQLARQNFVFGLGSPAVLQDSMILAGATNSTAQNSSLTMLLLFGIGGGGLRDVHARGDFDVCFLEK